MQNLNRKSETINIEEMAESVFRAADDLKAIEPLMLDLKGLASFSDYLFICSGSSNRQVKSIAEKIDEIVKKNFGIDPIGREGEESGLWVLLDYGDIVCHIFHEESREFYQIEDLWHDAKRVEFS